MPDLDAENVPEAERDQQTCQAPDQRQKIVLLPGADHPLEELAAIEDADPVEKHDQARQADRPYDLGLRCKRADGEADKKHRTDAERETEDADLANQIAHSDGQKCRQDGLGSDDIARKIQHVLISPECSWISVRDSPRPGTAREPDQPIPGSEAGVSKCL